MLRTGLFKTLKPSENCRLRNVETSRFDMITELAQEIEDDLAQGRMETELCLNNKAA
jgi:hypothetical protein